MIIAKDLLGMMDLVLTEFLRKIAYVLLCVLL